MPKSDIPSHVARAVALGRGNALQPRSSAPTQPKLAPHVLRAIGRGITAAQPKAVRPGVLQPAAAPSSMTVNKIEGVLRNFPYPIGTSTEVLSGGTGKYDVGAEVYDRHDTVLGSQKYSASEMIHAEMAALEEALQAGNSLDDIASIRVTKGCCRRCAAVLHMLGLADKVGPKLKSSSYGGAYKIPPAVRGELASKLGKFSIDDMAWVVENGSWW